MTAGTLKLQPAKGMVPTRVLPQCQGYFGHVFFNFTRKPKAGRPAY